MLPALLLALVCLGDQLSPSLGCQLPSDWRPLSESCRAELAEIIVYAKVLALHQEMYSLYNYLPWQYEAASEGGLFYSAEIEMLCDQAWGSMLEVPAGSRLNLTGLGYFSCHSHTVVQGYSYFFFLRMDENYNLLPHGVNFQDAIFPDTQENRRMFSSLFQFSNCTHGQQPVTFSSDWEIQEDNRERENVRGEAIFLYGDVIYSGGRKYEQQLKIHAFQCLVPLLFHLADPCPEVVVKTKSTFMRLAILFNWGFRKELFTTLAWREGLGAENDIFLYMVESNFGDYHLFLLQAFMYVKSPQKNLQRAAMKFIGGMLQEYFSDLCFYLNKSDVKLLTKKFEELRRDQDPNIRKFYLNYSEDIYELSRYVA